ncbi:hypothetical protein FRC02_010950 [Tulasnella sp. 418]|nr:hypothetical protein FRC02_010950 [Tulasnella sp. 418]
MVAVNPQLAAILTALTISSVSAVAVPQNLRSRDQVQFPLIKSGVLRSQAHVGRRDVPVAPLPRKFLADSKNKEHYSEAQSKSTKQRSKKPKGKKNHGARSTREDIIEEARIYQQAVAKLDSIARESGSSANNSGSPIDELETDLNKRDEHIHEHIHEHDHGHKHHHHGHHHHHHHHHDRRLLGKRRLEREPDSMIHVDAVTKTVDDDNKEHFRLLGMKVERRHHPDDLRDHVHATHFTEPKANAEMRASASEKRSWLRLGGPRYRGWVSINGQHYQSSYYRPQSGSLIHIGVGKRHTDSGDEALDKRNVYIGPSGQSDSPSTIGLVVSLNEHKEHLNEARHSDHYYKHHGKHHHHHGHHHGHEHIHSHTHKRAETMEGVEGVIDIVSPMAEAAARKIASLMLSNDPSDKTSFVLNASNSSATHVFLVPVKSSNDTTTAESSEETIPVTLHVPVFSPDEASMVQYCATYDPNPPSPSPLTAQPCTSEVTTHSSQIFSYNPANGVIIPMWAVNSVASDPSSASSETDTTSVTTTILPSSTTAAPSQSSTATEVPAVKRAADSYIVQAQALPSATVSPAFAKDSPCQSDAESESMQSQSDQPSAMEGHTPINVTMIFTPATTAVLPAGVRKETVDTDELKSTSFFPASSDEDQGGTEDAIGQENLDDDTDSANSASGLDPTPTSTTQPSVSSTSAEPSKSTDAINATSVDDAGLFGEDGMGEEDGESLDVFNAEVDESLPASLPSMTPVQDAATPYSWMFTPSK